MKTRLAYLAASVLTVALAAPARAHDFWLEPSTFLCEAPATVTLGLRVGEKLEGRGVRRRGDSIQRFVVAGPDGIRDVPGLEGSDPAGLLRIDEPGLYVVGYVSRGQVVELDAEVFERYLGEEGLEAVVEERRRLDESAQPGRERFVRSVKTRVRSTPEPSDAERIFDRKLGLPLELILEGEAMSLDPAEGLVVRVLLRGEPVAGALVVAMRRDDELTEFSARSDPEGRVRLPLSGGNWLVKSVMMVRAESDPEVDWISYWASVTFAGARTK